MERQGDEKSHKDNYIDSLREELLYLIEREVSPLAMKYGYSDVPLESKIKWKPIVLILGNYSSGKSTLINDLIGAPVQLTGQAPTDDAFTVITGSSEEEGLEAFAEGELVEERDGKVLLQDPQYPFETLRRHGERFAAHLRLKKVKSGRMANLAIVDTPGMLDSIAEKDRGYDYQEVIGDLAQIADLVLVLFDPHKAGTVRESHASLRYTLPERTFEDRLIFVLNRIDECGNLDDMLRVYGTLCWNLSQMTGRKDIPRILLTYSPSHSDGGSGEASGKAYLKLLTNQREQLHKIIFDAPRHRLDHLASFLEFHSYRLAHLLEALNVFQRLRSGFYLKHSLLGLLACLLIAALSGVYVGLVKPFGPVDEQFAMAGGLCLGLCVYGLWQVFLYKVLAAWQRTHLLQNLDELTPLRDQRRKDSWAEIRPLLAAYLARHRGRLAGGGIRREWERLQSIQQGGAQEIREAINELSSARPKPLTRRSPSLR